MQKRWFTILIIYIFITAGSVFAQGHSHNNPSHTLWPDSLNTITVTGTVLIDSSTFHPMYYLDENGDNQADYHLSFGPWWYKPESGATRPSPGQTVTIVGSIQSHMTPPTLLVFEINGLKWRDPVGYGRHGWNDGHFWNQQGDTLTVTGIVFVDTSYFYKHYFLDTNNDSIPEYKLSFGPPWYRPASGATRPADGDTVTILGRAHDMLGVDLLTVYIINGLEWRSQNQPAPWAGMWMHRNHSDSTYAFCVNNSTNWVGFEPGHMGHGMGSGMFPDSVFVQFWRIHPDSLPGGHHAEHFRGFYLNIHEPSGNSIMDGRFGGHHGRMQFQKVHQFRFHYEDEELANMGLSEDGIMMKYWDDETNQWRNVVGLSVNTQSNTVTFSSSELSNFYTLSAPNALTGIESSLTENSPANFVLHQNYPNPFNPSTTIRFDLAADSHVRLSVYNLLGQRIADLINENRAAGGHTVEWHGRNDVGIQVSSGIYLIKLEANGQVKIGRMTLLK